MIQKFMIEINNDIKITKHQIHEAIAKEIKPWNIFKVEEVK